MKRQGSEGDGRAVRGNVCELRSVEGSARQEERGRWWRCLAVLVVWTELEMQAAFVLMVFV